MATQVEPQERDISPSTGNPRQRRTQNTRNTRSKENRTGRNRNEEEPSEDIEEQAGTVTEPQPGPSTDNDGPIRNIAFPTYKLLRRQHMKLTTATHHAQFLKNLQENHQVPKGLKPKVTVTTAELPRSLYIRWEQAHIELANTLRDILLEHWEITKESLDYEISQTYSELSEICSPEEMTTIDQLITKSKTNKVTELQQRRMTKEKSQPRKGGTAGSAAGNQSKN